LSTTEPGLPAGSPLFPVDILHLRLLFLTNYISFLAH